MKPTCEPATPRVQALALRPLASLSLAVSGAASSSMPSAVAFTQPGRSTTSASSTGSPCPRPVVSRTTSSARAENARRSATTSAASAAVTVGPIGASR